MPNPRANPPSGPNFWANILAALKRVVDQRGKVSAMFRLNMEGERGTPQEWVLFYAVFGALFGIPSGFLTFDGARNPISSVFVDLTSTSPHDRGEAVGRLRVIAASAGHTLYDLLAWIFGAIWAWFWTVSEAARGWLIERFATFVWLALGLTVCIGAVEYLINLGKNGRSGWLFEMVKFFGTVIAVPFKLLWKPVVIVLHWCFNVALVAAHTCALLFVQYWKLFWHAQLVFAGAKRPGDAVSEFANTSTDLLKEGINKLFDSLKFTNT